MYGKCMIYSHPLDLIASECPELSNPENGMVKLTGERTVGSQAWYLCNPGYILVGSESRTCQDNLQWTPEVPTCKRTWVGIHTWDVGQSLIWCDCQQGHRRVLLVLYALMPLPTSNACVMCSYPIAQLACKNSYEVSYWNYLFSTRFQLFIICTQLSL